MPLQNFRTSPGRLDLALLVAGTLLFAILSARFELFETFLAWTRPRERYQLDELPGVLLFAACGLAWYSWRRAAETRLELARRRAAETVAQRALAQNRELALSAMQVQDRERRMLARELHDELGQCLTAVKIDAVCLRDTRPVRASTVRTGAQTIIAMTSHMEEVVRDLARRLRPTGLDELGLAAALENCIDGWRHRMPTVQFDVQFAGDLDQFDDVTTMTLYRLIQEGLTNISKHATARHVDIALALENSAGGQPADVVLSMRNDGATRAAPDQDGRGLAGMRERVESLAGHFTLETNDNSAFGFVARIPVATASLP